MNMNEYYRTKAFLINRIREMVGCDPNITTEKIREILKNDTGYWLPVSFVDYYKDPDNEVI